MLAPGHGPVCRGDEVGRLLTAMDGYLAFVAQAAAESHAAGLTPLEAAQKHADNPYSDWAETERFVGNLHRAYTEIVRRRARRDPAHRAVGVAGHGRLPRRSDRLPRMSSERFPRRVVTGHTPDGVSVVLSDGPVPGQQGAARRRRLLPRDLEHRGRPGPDRRGRADRADRADPRRAAAGPGHQDQDQRVRARPPRRARPPVAGAPDGVGRLRHRAGGRDHARPRRLRGHPARRRHRRAARHRPRLGQPRRHAPRRWCSCWSTASSTTSWPRPAWWARG